MGNEHVSSQFMKLFDANLSEVITDEFKDIESSLDLLYNRQTHESAFTEYLEIGDVPDIPTFNGSMSYINFNPGFYTKIVPGEYAAAMQFERKLIDDDSRFKVIKNKARNMIGSAARTMDKIGIRQIANSFSASFDFQTSEEGISLCGQHLTKSGVSTTTGFNNALTTAFSKSSLAAARLVGNRLKSDIGERIETDFDTIIVPDSLAQQAYEMTQTPAGLYTAEGTSNYWKGKYKIIVLKRLDDTSTTNWWLVDSKRMKKYLAWLDRIKPEVETIWDFETKSYKTSIYFRIGAGFLSYKWILGSQV